MVQYLILCRSLTYAQKAAHTLERAGITVSIQRAPKEISKEGCAYCVRVSERKTESALATLRAAGTRFGRVYRKEPSGMLCEVTL